MTRKHYHFEVYAEVETDDSGTEVLGWSLADPNNDEPVWNMETSEWEPVEDYGLDSTLMAQLGDAIIDPSVKADAFTFFENIDYPLLRDQKQAVLATFDQLDFSLPEAQTTATHLEGILNLLDAIQDFAIDRLGVTTEAEALMRDEEEGV